ncbi:hypothetical protein TNCV_4721401 [Trichonephila clavipes]|uniref:Uncharacterized protein n=1 Tax=Trichonephila clavipes TaxID=2585209 RepID=A0A8X7BG02_TRICX|nr:hypothetical protein TNCV_4721401 [Trichonephila clavipes]
MIDTAIQKAPGVSCLLFADDVEIWATGISIHFLEDALNSSLLILATPNNVEVTVCQLSTKQHLFNLEYKGLPL